MGLSQKWFRVVRKKFIRSSGSDIVLPRTSYSTNNSHRSEEAILRNETATFQDIDLLIPTFSAKIFNKEDVAAIRIQAYFRGHLARRAYRALKSLVKVQALVRGVRVRRQSRTALQCMHALVRLQVRVRSRQLLGRSNDNDNRYILT